MSNDEMSNDEMSNDEMSNDEMSDDEMSDDLEKTIKLADHGYELLKEKEYEQALEVAAQLEERKYTATFEIAALAHDALGNTEEAVEVLEKGVDLVPTIWLNWHLLGNLRSDLGRYEQAHEAYKRALRCPHVDVAMVRYNQGVLLSREKRYAEALWFLEDADAEDPVLQLMIKGAKIWALWDIGRVDEAMQLADDSLTQENFDISEEETIEIGICLERMCLESGESREEVRESTLALIQLDPSNQNALALLRDVDGIYSERSRYLSLLLHGHCPMIEKAAGYYRMYHVVADTVEAALLYVEEIETLAGHTNTQVEEWEIVEARAEAPQGVYWVGAITYYGEDDDDPS